MRDFQKFASQSRRGAVAAPGVQMMRRPPRALVFAKLRLVSLSTGEFINPADGLSF